LRQRKAELRPDHPVRVATECDVGLLYCAAGRFADAIPLLEEVRQKDPTYLQQPWFASGILTACVRTGRKTEAIALAKEHVKAGRKQFAADSPQLATALADTGKLLLEAKAYAEAEPLLVQSYQGMKQCEAKVLLENPRSLTEALERLVQLYDAWDKPA